MLIFSVSSCYGVFQGTILNTTPKPATQQKYCEHVSDVVVFQEASTELCCKESPRFYYEKNYYSNIILKQLFIIDRTDPVPQSSLCVQVED